MHFKDRKPYIPSFVLTLALLGGMLAPTLTKRALAAPQAQVPSSTTQSTSESEVCDSNAGWMWTNGPFKPDIAAQAQQELKQKGIDASVEARSYGEADSCGTYSHHGLDFTISLTQAGSAPGPSQQALADEILPVLDELGRPSLGNVKLVSPQGEITPLNQPNRLSTTTQSIEAETLTAEAVTRNVYVIVYDPLLNNGQRLTQYLNWNDHALITQQTIDFFSQSSNNGLNYTVAETTVVTSGWPELLDGFIYTEASYLAVLANPQSHHEPTGVNYNKIVNSPGFDICGKLNRGEIDEVWIYGGPWFGFYESTLVGPGAYNFNSPPVGGTHNCNKLLPIMGPSFERTVHEAVHNFGHRAEATMTKVYGNWQQNNTSHNWNRFALVKAQSPNYSYSGCGSTHYPPNGLADYDYANPGNTLTNCADFNNYPNLGDPLTVAQPITCTTWNCDQLGYLMYWFTHLPSNIGCGSDGVANNWWSYFSDPSLALYPSLNCPPVPPDPLLPGDTVRVSVNSAGGQGIGGASQQPRISADGRFVVFRSYAGTLVWGDTNGAEDIFLRDLQTGVVTRVSVDSNGVQANNGSDAPSISADGLYTAFASSATNLTPNDANGKKDIFVHDSQTGITTLVSVDSSGVPANGFSYEPSISANGRYIAFISDATNLVPGDTNGSRDVFVRDLQTSLTARVSVTSSNAQASNMSLSASISADGRYITFSSSAGNLVSGDTNAGIDVFVRDLQTGLTTRASVDSNGAQATNGNSFNPSISGDGRYVAFVSAAVNLVAGDTNATADIFLRDRQMGVTKRVSVASGGMQANKISDFPSISGDGRYISFYSDATNLVSDDTNGAIDAFTHDAQTGETTRVSVDSSGTQANDRSDLPSISTDGQYIAFQSYATNLTTGDTNGSPDIFIHRQNTLPPSTVTPTFTPTNTLTNTPTRTPTFTPTFTPTYTPTNTPTAPSSASNNPLYLSFTSSQTLGGIASADEDIWKFDGQTWTLFFDGSDVGVASPDLFAFSLLDSDSILMSFSTAVTVGGLAITPQDIVRFDATGLGATTTGAFSMYLDGSDVGLDVSGDSIDSVSLLTDGRILISTTGNPVVPGVSGKDEDLLAFTPTSLGDVTAGTWTMYFDGSDVGLAETSDEEIDALDVIGGNIYLSTLGDFSVNGVAGADEDVFVCAATSLGDVTACNYSPALYFDGSTWGLAANDVDAINLVASGTGPTATFTPTFTVTAGPSPTFTPTPTRTATSTIGPSPTYTPTLTITPTKSSTPTHTPTTTVTVTSTPSQSNPPLYFSLSSGGTLGGVSVGDVDIAYFNGSNWSLFFDASDVGIPDGTPDVDLNDFHIVDADTILMSFDTPFTLGTLFVDPWDVLQFDATSLGANTAGSFSVYFDGSDVGLDDAVNEVLDALDLLPDGRLLLSTNGSSIVPGVSGRDEDLLTFTPFSLGANTSGSWAMYFDGSLFGLGDSAEDIDAVNLAPNGDIYLSAADPFAVSGIAGEDEDIFLCTPTMTAGMVSACVYSSTLYFDGSIWGLSANDLDGIDLP